MFIIVPVFMGCIIGGVAIFGITRWVMYMKSPIEIAHVKIVSKRLAVSGSKNGSSTSYYVTVEFDDGTRKEFSTSGKNYSMVADNDSGQITYKWKIMKDFVRVVKTHQDEPSKFCEHCGTIFATDAVRCPACGATRKKS